MTTKTPDSDSSNNHNNTKTYYDILGLKQSTVTNLDDIKKAYRKLALQYHPDRCTSTAEDKQIATTKFQEIGEAYDCLSDPLKKRDYDDWLLKNNNNGHNRQGKSNNSTYSDFQEQPQRQQRPSGASSSSSSPQRQRHHIHHHPRFVRRRTNSNRVDPFQQFDYVFRTDPFFRDAFKDLDDEFARRFQQQQQSTQNPTATATATATTTTVRGGTKNNTFTTTTSPPPPSPQTNNNNNSCNEGWFFWLLRQCGIQFQVSSFSKDRHGNVSAKQYYSSSSKNNTTTTAKVSRTYVDNYGRRITIKKMQRGPNSIEDKYHDNILIERRVNGQTIVLNNVTSATTLA